MNRFNHLLSLRKLQEDLAGAEVGRANGRVKQLVEQMRILGEETRAGTQQSREDLTHFGERLMPETYEDFLKGQAWREKKLQSSLAAATKDVEEKTALWQGAHRRSKQVEILADLEEKQQALRRKRAMDKAMDEVAAAAYRRRSKAG